MMDYCPNCFADWRGHDACPNEDCANYSNVGLKNDECEKGGGGEDG